MKRATRKKLDIVFSDTTKVGLWVFVSAGLTALLSWMLRKPEFVSYYGVINVFLFLLKKINDEFRK